MYNQLKKVHFNFNNELIKSEEEIIEFIQISTSKRSSLFIPVNESKILVYGEKGITEETQKLIPFIQNLDKNKYSISLQPINFSFLVHEDMYQSLASLREKDKFTLFPIIFGKMINNLKIKSPAELEYYIYSEEENKSMFYRIYITKNEPNVI